jgi:predicted nuclease of restriction endonuclease-like (RecB) superfamily
MSEAEGQGWTTRSLEGQISTLYYERLLATSDRPAVENEARQPGTLPDPTGFRPRSGHAGVPRSSWSW